jgi:alcohol dehydrogenase class IV
VAANINLPRILRVGAGASGQLVATLAELGLSRPLLVTDPYIKDCGYCAQLQASLDAAGIA